jgi:competence protein ComEC
LGANGLKRHYLAFSGRSEERGSSGWVTLALTPLTLLLFGQVSVVGLLANALAIPWMTLVVTPLAMLGVLLAQRCGSWRRRHGGLLVYLQWLAAWPWAALSLAKAPLWAGCWRVYMGGVALVLPWGGACGSWDCPCCCRCCCGRRRCHRRLAFELLAADVGQGNAVLVRTARHALLYDAGPRYSLESDAGHRVLVPLLQACIPSWTRWC